jgi:hypothetical protein
MLCIKGKIPRKIWVKLIFQEDVIANIKMNKILYRGKDKLNIIFMKVHFIEEAKIIVIQTVK